MAGQTMKRNSKPGSLRPSPNELQELVRQEREKWRIFRIQQVREQAKQEAQRVREAVHKQEKRILNDLREKVVDQWQVEKEKRVIQLEKEYQACLNNIGEAHRQAKEQPNADDVLQQQAEHNQRLAAQRGQKAGRQQREEAKQQHHQKNRLLKQRHDVMRLEKLRARHIAELPVPEVFRKKIVKEKKPPPKVAFHEAGTLTTTHYVPQNVRIEKEVWSSKPSAKEKAVVEEAERMSQMEARQRQAEEERLRREQRGREALKREHLTNLLEHLMAGLDEAQHQHHLSHFLHGKDGDVWKFEETRLKEETHQQKQMEEAVEKLMKKEEDKKEEKDEYDLGNGIILEPSKESSDYLEEIESSEDVTWGTTSKTKVRGLRSLLKEVERQHNRILQELEDSIPVRGPSEDGGDGSLKDQERDIHLADTIPVHLHSGHFPTRSLPKGPAPGFSPPSQPEERPVEAQPDTTEASDSSSTVLPLSEESIPVSSDSTQHTTSTSLPHRFSTPQEQQTEPRDTRARQPHPSLSDFHKTISDAKSLNSEDIKINVDLDVGSSSLVASDSSLEQQQSESYISSTEYYSLPSDIPRKVSLQEIEDNLQRIQEQRQRNQSFIDSLSRKRTSPGQISTTYLEKLKEDGSGKKPLTRKEKYELQKKELIRFYIQKLLQRGDQEGEVSASTVEGSGLTLSSLGSFLGYLEGDGQGDQCITSSSGTSSSTTSRSLSSYEDIDEFSVKMKPRDWHLPPQTSSSSSSTSSIISTCSHPHSIHTDPHYTATVVTATDLCHTTTTHPYYHITSVTTTTTSSTSSPSFTPYHPLLHPHSRSSSTTYPPYHISDSQPESHVSSSTSTSLKHELNDGDSVCITPSAASVAGSLQEISSSAEGNQKYFTPHSYLTPPREDESSLEDSEVAPEHPTTRHADPCKQLRWYAIQRQRMRARQHADTTTTSEDSQRRTTTKFSEVSRNNLGDFRFIVTIPSVITQTSITSSDIPGGSVSKLSKLSLTKMTDVGLTEADRSVISPVTSTATIQTVSHSSGESTVSMPDMTEVLRRFGLGETKSKSSSATPSNEEDDDNNQDDDGVEK